MKRLFAAIVISFGFIGSAMALPFVCPTTNNKTVTVLLLKMEDLNILSLIIKLTALSWSLL